MGDWWAEARSVMPRRLHDREPVVEGEAKSLGVMHVGANGAQMKNCGQQNIRFKKAGPGGISDILFQVTDVGKPSASVPAK